MGKQKITDLVDRIYGSARVGRKFILAAKKDGLASMVGVLTFDHEDELERVVKYMKSGETEAGHSYGKLKLGKCVWLTRSEIGQKNRVLGIAVSDSETEVDAVLGFFGDEAEQAA